MRFFLISFLLCFSNFGGFVTLVTKFYAPAIQYLLVGSWCLVFLSFAIVRRFKDFEKFLRDPLLYCPVLLILIIVSIEIINSCVLGNRSFSKDVLEQSIYFCAIISLFPMTFLFSYFIKNDRSFFKKTILLFTIVQCSLGLVQDFFIIFFRGPLFLTTSYSIRNGFPRFLFPSGCNWLVLCYCYSSFFQRQKEFRFLRIFCFILIVMTDCLIIQTRGLIITNCILLLVLTLKSVFFKKTNGWLRFSVASTIVVFSGVILGACLCVFSHSFIFSLVYSDLSLTARIDAIRYFFSSFLSHPFFGRGFFQEETNSSSAFYFYHGYQGFWTRIDVGLVGFLDLFGSLAFVLYFYLILHYLRLLKSIDGTHESWTSLGLSILFFTIATIPTLCVFDYERFLVLCVSLSLASCLNAGECRTMVRSSRIIL